MTNPEAAGIGHNSGTTGAIIKSFIGRIEKLEDERDTIKEDIKDVYLEFKSKGLDSKVLKKIVKQKKASVEKLREEKELFDLYCNVAGETQLILI